MYKST